jgi:hypothetical protein
MTHTTYRLKTAVLTAFALFVLSAAPAVAAAQRTGDREPNRAQPIPTRFFTVTAAHGFHPRPAEAAAPASASTEGTVDRTDSSATGGVSKGRAYQDLMGPRASD